MTTKMPRGAIPTPRSELAASETYRPDIGPKVFVPSGEFPTPNFELASAQPYRAVGAAPEIAVRWPNKISFAGNEGATSSNWVEEAFAKACVEPKILIPTDVMVSASQSCGSSNFAEFMQTHGFQVKGKAYLDGPFQSVNWTSAEVLHNAIANVGPVKIGVSESLNSGRRFITPGTNGWAVHGLSGGPPGKCCASLCGYGTLAALVSRFEEHGISVSVPEGMPTGLCYAMFLRNSIGIIDRQSLINVTCEAWVRNPTTLIKDLRA